MENFCAILVKVKKKFNAEEKACANWCIGISYETYIYAIHYYIQGSVKVYFGSRIQ